MVVKAGSDPDGTNEIGHEMNRELAKRRVLEVVMASVVGISLILGMASTAAADPVTPDPTATSAVVAPEETETASPEESSTSEASDDPTSSEPSSDEPATDPDQSLPPEDEPAAEPGTPATEPEPGLSDDERFAVGGYIPWQGDTKAIDDGTYSSGLLRGSYLSPAFNLRDNRPKWKPGTRDQGGFGTCWSFASAEAAESSLVRNGAFKASKSSPSRQISSLHTVQAVYYTKTFPANTKYPLSFNGPYNQGGNTDMAATAWSHWYGAQKASSYKDPKVFYKAPKKISAAKLKSSAFHLRNYWQLPRAYNSAGVYSSANVNTIKNAIYTYGALSTSLAFYSDYYSIGYYGNYFYDPYSDRTNHAVVIIGWDDNVSRYNFGFTPPANGAFLIQNSWGKDRYYEYFWVSYYDRSLSNTAVFDLGGAKSTAGHRSPYDWTANYSYDSLGLVGYPYLSTWGSVSFGNKFTARSATTLRAVQIATRQPNTSYSVSVYVGAIKTGSVSAGGKAATIGSYGSKTLYGYATYSGYQTLTLDTPVKLKKGQRFSIVVTESTSGSIYLPAESAVNLGSSGMARPTIKAHQSYVLWNGYWQDAKTVYKSTGNTGWLGNVNVIGLTSPTPKFLVKYNANGGKVSSASKTVTFMSAYGKLATPKRAGYNFAGWYTAPSGGKKITAATKMTAGSNTTIFAHWKGKPFKVTFNVNGGKALAKPTKTVRLGAQYGQMPTPTRTGYYFYGWFTAKSGGSQVWSTSIMTGAKNRTLYAHWTPGTYTVNFVPQQGSVYPSSMVVTYGKPYGNLPVAVAPGYTFTGWYTAPSGGAAITATSKVKITQTTSLYAHWKPAVYQVVLNPNGGTVSPTSVSVVFGGTYGGLPTPSRPGFTFLGWYTAASGGTLITATTVVQIYGTTTLYAHWR